MRFLGDIVVVKHLGKNVTSNLIVVPQTARNDIKAIKAVVIAVGEMTPKRRRASLQKRKILANGGKYNRNFPCDNIVVGDVVLVPEELGSRGRVPGDDDAIIYDGEDILALVEEETDVAIV